MQTVQVRPSLTRDVEILVASDNHSELAPLERVERMFDENGAETFDPLEAVEIDASGSLRKLKSGDRLTVIVQW